VYSLGTIAIDEARYTALRDDRPVSGKHTVTRVLQAQLSLGVVACAHRQELSQSNQVRRSLAGAGLGLLALAPRRGNPLSCWPVIGNEWVLRTLLSQAMNLRIKCDAHASALSPPKGAAALTLSSHRPQCPDRAILVTTAQGRCLSR